MEAVGLPVQRLHRSDYGGIGVQGLRPGEVRDLTREWQGHLIVRGEEPPWKKAVGACFPALPS